MLSGHGATTHLDAARRGVSTLGTTIDFGESPRGHGDRSLDQTIRFCGSVVCPSSPGWQTGLRQYFFSLAAEPPAFFEWPGEPVPEKDHGVPVRVPSTSTLLLEVESEDALWVLKDRLAAAGFWSPR